jgi:hypothetical protein
MLRLTGSFNATGDDGREYTVNIFTDASTLEDQGEVEVPKRLQTSSGHTVSRIQHGEYVIVLSGVKLRSNDPKAP